MSTERETAHVVRSWLEAGATRLPDRVLDAVLDQVPATPQRRPFWRARRFSQMTNPVRYAVAAAAVLVVALIGFRFLPANDSFGGPTTAAPTTAPTIAPSSPTPAPLATGEFSSHGVAASIDARGAGSDVTGTMALSDTGLTATVDLECSRTTESGLLMIGGLLTNSTFTEFFPAGHRVAVVFQAGAPVKAVWYIVLPGDEPMPTCQALMDFMATDEAEFIDGLEPIEGTVQLGP